MKQLNFNDSCQESSKKTRRCMSLLLSFLMLTLAGHNLFAQNDDDPPVYCTAGFFWGCGFNGGINDFNDFIIYGGGINHIGAGCAGGFGDTGGYGDYTSVTSLHGNLYQGQTYDFTVGFDTSNIFVKIWIDLNGNGDFEDSGEMVFWSTQESAYGGINGTFKIPVTSQLITTRMRVIMTINDQPYTSCGIQGILGGGVHDYTVTILPESTCYIPALVSTSNISDVSANLSWTSNGTLFDIEWGETGFTQGNGTVVNGITNTSYTLTELIALTSYQYYIRQNCEGNSEVSDWSGPYTFKTLCTPVDSFSEDFDSDGPISQFLNYDVPDCWNGIIAKTGSIKRWVSNATDEDYHLRLYSDGTQSATITLLPPVNNINAGTHWLRFRARVSGLTPNGSGGTLQIGYIDVNDGVFVEVMPITINNTTYGGGDDEYMAVFSTTIPDTARIAIRNPGVSGADHYLDDVHWELAPDCIHPLNIKATGITQNKADLSWVSNGTSFEIEYGETGFVQNSGTTITELDNFYTLEGLNADTEYDYYVRQNCGNNGYSTWSGPFTFKTWCTPVDTIIENFDDLTTEYSIPVPNCWDDIISSNSNVNDLIVTTSGPPASSGTYRMRQRGSTIAILPPVSNINSGTHWLRFKAVVWATEMGYLQVGYITDVDDISTFVQILQLTINNTEWTDSEYTIPFTSDIPANARIAVRSASTSSTVEIYWDDLRWEPAIDCIFPINLTATNISDQSTVLSWESDGTTFDIEYGLEGFLLGEGTVISEAGNPYTITSLNSGTSYDYYVRRDCGDEDYSIWTGPFSFKPGSYLGSIPTSLNQNPIVNDDACATSFSIEVPSGQYLSSLNVKYSMLSTSSAWTSQQRSVLYSPSLGLGEDVVVAGEIDFPGIQPYDRNVTFANGSTGIVEFELKAWRTTGGTGCGTDLIYVVDGTWILTPQFEDIPTCPDPATDLSYSNITEDSVDLIWEAESGSFQIIWDNAEFDPETEGTLVSGITTNSYTLSGLDSSVLYEFYVRRDCSSEEGEDFGEWVGPVQFNPGYCLPSVSIVHYFTQFYTTNAIDNIIITPTPGVGYVNSTSMVIGTEAGGSFNFTSNYIGGASGLRIWIDWNNDYIFEDSEEVFYQGSANGNKSGVITIPSDALSGDYRIRVRGQAEANSVPSSCGQSEYGQTIDFTLSIPCGEVSSPVGSATQTFTSGSTLSDLSVDGSNLVWYSDSALTDVLDDTTLLVDGTTYYVVNLEGNCSSSSISVTVSEVLSSSDFTHFGFGYHPNPVSEVLYLRANTDIKSVVVFNMLGQELSLPIHSNNTQIDMTGLPSGNYVMSVTIEGVNKTFKIVKIK